MDTFIHFVSAFKKKKQLAVHLGRRAGEEPLDKAFIENGKTIIVEKMQAYLGQRMLW